MERHTGGRELHLPEHIIGGFEAGDEAVDRTRELVPYPSGGVPLRYRWQGDYTIHERRGLVSDPSRLLRGAECQKRDIKDRVQGDQRVVDAHLLSGRPGVWHDCRNHQQPRFAGATHAATRARTGGRASRRSGMAKARPKARDGAATRIAECAIVRNDQASRPPMSARSGMV